MRKLFLAVAAICCAGVASAEVVTTTYYGEKSVKDSGNPCRGATIRVCAQISTFYPDREHAPGTGTFSLDEAAPVKKIIRVPLDASPEDRATLFSLANPAKGVYVVMGTKTDND